MLTNHEVFTFQGSNAELCQLCGKTPKDDSPAHWANFTARALKEKAGLAVAAGKGEEIFDAGRSRTGGQPKNTAIPATPVAIALPAAVAAMLPAITMRLTMGGQDVSGGIKQWLLTNSTPACLATHTEAVLPYEVREVFDFFKAGTPENFALLLAYAGVSTLRSLRVDGLKAAIKTLAAENLATWEDDRLAELEKLLIAFAKHSEHDAATPDVPATPDVATTDAPATTATTPRRQRGAH